MLNRRRFDKTIERNTTHTIVSWLHNIYDNKLSGDSEATPKNITTYITRIYKIIYTQGNNLQQTMRLFYEMQTMRLFTEMSRSIVADVGGFEFALIFCSAIKYTGENHGNSMFILSWLYGQLLQTETSWNTTEIMGWVSEYIHPIYPM